MVRLLGGTLHLVEQARVDLEHLVLVFVALGEYFQVVHDRTAPPAVVLGEPMGGVHAQVDLEQFVFQHERLAA